MFGIHHSTALAYTATATATAERLLSGHKDHRLDAIDARRPESTPDANELAARKASR